jgi:hypothetical protein
VVRLGDLSAVFVSADEPRADAHWRVFAAAFPKAIRVHGLRASWSTIRRLAKLSDSDRFMVVRGDTMIDPVLAEHVVDDELMDSAATLAWPTRNAVNGLCYASGAIRCCWGPGLLAGDPGSAPPEIVAPRALGTIHPHGSPLQAFRAGFRESVALGLVGGRAPGPPRPASHLPATSLKRLLVWTSIGADQDNGLWCLYGARLGCKMSQLDQFDPALLLRPDWIGQLWHGRIAPAFAGPEMRCLQTGYAWDRTSLEAAVRELGEVLRRELALEIVELEPEQSRFLRQIRSRDFDVAAFDRLGNLYRDGEILPKDLQKAAQNYAIGALLGSSNAADNLARLHLKGEGVPRDRLAAIALLSQATGMGSPHAPYHLAQAYLSGAGPEGSDAKAVDLLQLACRRGFTPAHAALAELYRAGRGVARDLETALVHGLLAGKAGAALADALRGELANGQISRAEQRAREWQDVPDDQARSPGQRP